MRKLAGTTWGANQNILKTVYQGTERPHLEYGSSSWMTVEKNTPPDPGQSPKPSVTYNYRQNENNTHREDGESSKH